MWDLECSEQGAQREQGSKGAAGVGSKGVGSKGQEKGAMSRSREQ